MRRRYTVMWVETGPKNTFLVNCARFDSVFVSGNAVMADKRVSDTAEDDIYETLFTGETADEAYAALLRIRDALARGEKFVSLRKPPVVPVYTEAHIKEAVEMAWDWLKQDGEEPTEEKLIDSVMEALTI